MFGAAEVEMPMVEKLVVGILDREVVQIRMVVVIRWALWMPIAMW